MPFSTLTLTLLTAFLATSGCASALYQRGEGSYPRVPSASKSVDKTSIIFTAHSMMPSAEGEFRAILESLNPDTLFVEISPEDLSKGSIGDYPGEMTFALRWGKARGKQVFGFDCGGDDATVLPQNVKDEILRKYFKHYEGKTWRDRNNPQLAREGIEIASPLHDPGKVTERHQCMLENIRAHLAGAGSALVITGGSHSVFFRETMPDASFPLTTEP